MKRITLIVFSTLAFVFITTGLFAQIGPPPPPATPIDGGAGALLVLGAAYGVKKIYNSKFSQKED